MRIWKLTQKCIYGTVLIVHLWEYLPTGVRQILYRCLHGDISPISQLYSRSCTLPNRRHFIVSNFRKTFHLFWNMGNFQHYQYSRLPLIKLPLKKIKVLLSSWNHRLQSSFSPSSTFLTFMFSLLLMYYIYILPTIIININMMYNH